MKVIVLTGAPGAGKTEAGKRLTRLIQPAIGIDLDELAWLQPWTVDDRLYDLMAANLVAVLENARAAGIETAVVSGVIVPGAVYDRLVPQLGREGFDWRFIVLRASAETLTARIASDTKSQDPGTRTVWTTLDAIAATIPGAAEIRTDALTLDEVVECVRDLAGTEASPPAVDDAALVPLETAVQLAAGVLRSAGFGEDSLHVATELVENDAMGYESHGLIRLEEYLSEARDGGVNPSGRPRATAQKDPRFVEVVGGSALGIVTKRLLVQTIIETAMAHGVAVVTAPHARHLGRLGTMASEVSARGLVLIGFVNYSGAGQKVIPWNGRTPRIASNPIVFGFPSGTRPVVFDASTSAVSEGSVRVVLDNGGSLPGGVLKRVVDGGPAHPKDLYDGQGGIAPLGGVQGHKGFGLAVMVDLLAGVLSGGGASRADADQAHGNSALFIAVDPGRLGLEQRDIEAHVSALREHVRSGSGNGTVRLPGERSPAATRIRLPWSMRRLSSFPSLADS